MKEALETPLRELLLGTHWRRAARVRVVPTTEGKAKLHVDATPFNGEIEAPEISILTHAARPFRVTGLHTELLASGSHIRLDDLLVALERLAAAGAIVPDEAPEHALVSEPARLLVRALTWPWLYVPTFLVLVVAGAARWPEILGRAHGVVDVGQPWVPGEPGISPYLFVGWALVATLLTSYSRQIFRLYAAGGGVSTTHLNLALKGVIPVLHATAVVRGRGFWARMIAATTGLYFDLALIQLWTSAAGASDVTWRGVASVELGVHLALLGIALNPLVEYDASSALAELFGVPNLRNASAEALTRVLTRRRRRGDLALGGYRVLGFVYMGLVLYVLTRLFAGFAGRTWYMSEPSSLLLAGGGVLAVWILYLARRGFPYLRRRVATVILPAGDGALRALGAVDVPVTTGLRDNLTFVRGDGHPPFSASALGPRVAVFAADSLPSPPTDAAPEDDELSMAIYRRPYALIHERDRRRLEIVKALRATERTTASHELVPDVDVMVGYPDRGFTDLIARMEGLTVRELVTRMSTRSAPAQGSIVERLAMVARDRVSGAIDAVVVEGAPDVADERLEAIRASFCGVDVAAPELARLHAALGGCARPEERAYLASLRGLSISFQEKFGVVPLLFELDPARFDAELLAAARAIGLLVPDWDAKGSWRFAIEGPSILVPLGPMGSPTGFKARRLHRGVRFRDDARPTYGWKRYADFVPPGRRASATAPEGELASLVGWYALPDDASSVFVHEGELKAMAHHELSRADVIGAGGLEWHAIMAVVAGLTREPKKGRVYICFDADTDPPLRKRMDGLTDSAFRGLQLGWMLHARGIDVRWVRGLQREGEKVDLDELFGLAADERRELLDTYARRIEEATRMETLLAETDGLKEYLEQTTVFAEELYGSMREALRRGAGDPAAAGLVTARDTHRLFEEARAIQTAALAIPLTLAARLGGEEVATP